MNRREIAEKINYKGRIVRTISTNYELDLVEGELYDNRDNIESWSGENCTVAFILENSNSITYMFICEDAEGHEVDYTNEEECEELGALDCESEGEVLILPSVKMRIVSVGSELDYEELGYYPVELEVIK